MFKAKRLRHSCAVDWFYKSRGGASCFPQKKKKKNCNRKETSL